MASSISTDIAAIRLAVRAAADDDIRDNLEIALLDRLGEAHQHLRVELIFGAAICVDLLLRGFGLRQTDRAHLLGVGETHRADAVGFALAFETHAFGARLRRDLCGLGLLMRLSSLALPSFSRS